MASSNNRITQVRKLIREFQNTVHAQMKSRFYGRIDDDSNDQHCLSSLNNSVLNDATESELYIEVRNDLSLTIKSNIYVYDTSSIPEDFDENYLFFKDLLEKAEVEIAMIARAMPTKRTRSRNNDDYSGNIVLILEFGAEDIATQNKIEYAKYTDLVKELEELEKAEKKKKAEAALLKKQRLAAQQIQELEKKLNKLKNSI